MIPARISWWLAGPLLLGCQSMFQSSPTGIPADAAGTPASGGSGGTGNLASTGGVAQTGGSASGGSGGTTLASGGSGGADITGTGPLCDVLTVLRQKCQSCHANPPVPHTVPMPLMTYDDLVAPSVSDPQTRVIDMSILRMQDTLGPMPPAPAARATAADVQVLQAWLDAGLPATCDEGTAGAAGAGPVVANPYDTPVTCTSNKSWTGGNDGSSNMHPGMACISCHTSGGGEEEGPRFTFAGTAYPSAHEPDDCNGVNGSSASAQVVITDASGATFTMNVNSVGNFSYSARGSSVVLPYRAKIVSGGLERVMATAQQSGDCNSCHTEIGANDAPGRIMAP